MGPLNSVTVLLLLCLTIRFCSANYQNLEDEEVFRKYIELDKNLKKIVNSGIKMVLPMLMEANGKLNVSAKCMGNILHLVTGIRKLKLSAFNFLDAAGKPMSAIMNGNNHMLGDYDQCLDSQMETGKGDVAFRGQYCLIEYRLLLPKKKRPITLSGGVEELVEATKNTSELVRYLVSRAHFFYYYPAKLGLCMPTGCSEDDVSEILTYMSQKIYVNASLLYCDSNSDVYLNNRNIAFISIFVTIGVLVLAGTFVEYYSWKNIKILKSFQAKFLMCFSVLTNFPNAISIKHAENHISCLHGIRLLTLFYVILLHQYYAITKYYTISHTVNNMEQIPEFFFQIIANGFLAADVFFFLGGFVNCYTRMKMEQNKRRKTNFFFSFLHKLVRIAPAYLFFSFLMSLFKPSGPMGGFQKTLYVEKCLKNWWQNFLFINNFFLQDDTCAPHTWYIAVDMQLFILSLVTIPVFFRSPKKGFVVNASVAFLGIIATVIWSWIKKLTPGVVIYRPNHDEIDAAWNAHTFTFPHIAPYFIGILMGYYMAAKDGNDIKLSKMYQVIGWPVAAILFTSMLFMTKVWNSGGAFTVVDTAFYFGFSKFLFVLAIAWMVLCCASGNGGIINYILTLPLWIPLSRVSYVVYLIAPFIQTYYFANSRLVLDGYKMSLIWRYAGDTLISCLLGFAIHTVIETPFLEIEKLLLYRQPPLMEEVVRPGDIICNEAAEKQNKRNELELNIKNLQMPS